MQKIKIVTLFILFMTMILVGCKFDISIDRYLKNNHSSINLDDSDDFYGMDIIKDGIKNKKVIFTGEIHAIDKDNEFKLKMLKYLQKEIGLKYYLDESGYSNAYFLNKYLDTGDENILKKVFLYTEGTMGCNKDDYNFYKEIYKLNQGLKLEDRIKIIGIDIEHTNMTSYDYIIDVIEDRNLVSDELKIVLDDLSESQGDKNRLVNLKKSIDILMIDVDKNKKLYKEIFKDEFWGFEIVLENIRSMCRFYSDDLNFTSIREDQIYKNFLRVDEVLEDAKYFGQWGAYHVMQDSFIDKYSNGEYANYFAAKLNKQKEFEGRVISMVYGYYNEKNNMNYMEMAIDKGLFNEYLISDENCIVFKLDGMKSPFKKKLLWPFVIDIDEKEGSVTTDYIQYVVLIKNCLKSKSL